VSPRQTLPAQLDGSAAARATRIGREINIDDAVVEKLAHACASIDTSDAARVEAGRDWWPLSTVWAVNGTVPALPAVVVRPGDTAEVSAVLAVCDEARVPLTVFAGASGVCGASIPTFGGVAMDMTELAGITDVDDTSLLVDVRAGSFGDWFEETLQADHGLTAGHWPQSIALSTVGGWVACRGAGQYSTRYGKIEDMVVGLEVVTADGTVIRTGGTAPRAATGPDLTQLFVGSEGTLGVITGVKLRVHPKPAFERRAVYGFTDFASGLDACRRVLRRGATPAVLRLYDAAESARNFEVETAAVLIVVDEGDQGIVEATVRVVADECRDAKQLDARLAGRWLEHRNQVPPLESLVRAGIVADTVEVSGSWASLPRIYRSALDALEAVDGTIAASAHQSHAYIDGGCLYFTFAGKPAEGDASAEAYYRKAFDAVMAATTSQGGALSHHHGIGINRSRYMRDYLGASFDMLVATKRALDPNGILNPGKLGLPSPFGEIWEG
jgi:alkyldihydroxyacetonephosphate synthase